MGLLKKVVSGVKKTVGKVVDVTQDSAKLFANAVVPIKNPYQADDFKTGFGKAGGKIQNVTDAISKQVAEDVVIDKLSSVPVTQGDGKNITTDGINPGAPQFKKPIEESSTLLGLGLKMTPPTPQSNVVNDVVATGSQSQTSVLPQNQDMTTAGAIFQGILGNVVSGFKTATPQIAANAAQTAAAAAFTSGAPQNMGVNGASKNVGNKQWYKTPMGIAGIVVGAFLLFKFIVMPLFKKRR